MRNWRLAIMMRPMIFTSTVLLIGMAITAELMAQQETAKPKQANELLEAKSEKAIKLFDGKSLEGWTGDSKVWTVRDGAIVGSSVDNKVKKNTFLVYEKKSFKDFSLTFKARLEGNNNSGVQYRSKVAIPKTWKVVGYQADIHPKPEYTAMLFGEGTGRHIIAQRGTRATLETDADESQVDKKAFEVKRVDLTKWHEYQVIARGNRLIHRLDGKTTIDLTDNHEKALKKGVIALQVHAGPPMTVYFKDIKLTEIEAESEASKDQE